MLPAALNEAIDSGIMLDADTTHEKLIADLETAIISWTNGPDNTLIASIPFFDGSDVVNLHIPTTSPKGVNNANNDFAVAYELTDENFGGDIRMSEKTRQILLKTALK